MQPRLLIIALLLMMGRPAKAYAQQVFFGAGAGVASLPRSVPPLCGSARRLTAPTFSGQTGLLTKRLRIAAGVDFTVRGYADVAACIPRSGVSTDSTFAAAGFNALTVSGAVWHVATQHFNVGVGAGWVHDRQSWFVSGGVGLQYRKLRAEMSARRHRTSFEEVTRDYSDQGVREISRFDLTEDSWGGSMRLLLVTR